MTRPKTSFVGFAGLLASFLLGLATPALAELEICNDTDVPHRVAVGYKESGQWMSRGWWSVEPGSCVTPIAEDLERRFYYFRAEGAGRRFQHNNVSFCTGGDSFTIAGNANCANRGYQKSDFARIDFGQEGVRVSQSLSSHSVPKGEQNLADASPDPGSWGPPFRGEAIFHGCSPVFASSEQFCTFVGSGRSFKVSNDERTPQDLFASLQEMDIGTPVSIKGDWFGLFDVSVDLVLREVTQRPANAEDMILSRIQGNWYSVADPSDQFTIVGSGRQNRYNNVQTAEEYLSVMPFCGEYDREGPYLYTWDSQGGTGLCYAIHEVSDTELLLTYLPANTELRYRRLE